MAINYVLSINQIIRYAARNQKSEGVMNLLFQIALYLYVYCTDFTINIANLLSISYYDVNALIFCILWPAITVMLIFFYLFQKIRLRRLK